MSKKLLIAKLIALFTRKVRFPGRERLLRLLFPPEYFRRMGSCEFTVTYNRNLRFRCDLGSYIEWQIFFKGYYAPDLSTVIKKLVKPGMQVMDIGANVGAYSLLIAERGGKDGKVIAFEPNPEVRQRLAYNVRLNRLDNQVRIFPFALSDEEGEFTLYVPHSAYPNRGIASLKRHVSEVLKEEIRIEVKTLDDIFVDTGLTQLDFLKVDTDGSDAEVLQGGMEVIKRFLPYIIFENYYLARSDAVVTIEKIRSQLRSLGYSFFTIGYFGRIRPCHPEKPLPDSDIVCIPAR